MNCGIIFVTRSCPSSQRIGAAHLNYQLLPQHLNVRCSSSLTGAAHHLNGHSTAALMVAALRYEWSWSVFIWVAMQMYLLFFLYFLFVPLPLFILSLFILPLFTLHLFTLSFNDIIFCCHKANMPNKIEFSDFAELDSRAQRLRSRKAEPGPGAGAETALLENGGLGRE